MTHLLTRAELAEAMGLSMETIRRLTAAQKIPFYQVGRSYRYDQSAVLAAVRGPSSAEAPQAADQAQKSALLG